MHLNTKKIVEIAEQAGEKILEIYNTEFSVTYKQSEQYEEGISPLTQADLAAHKHIQQELAKMYPNIPILSEESEEIPYEKRCSWETFFIVDPLDGTKEFIKKTGEFTVNIGLIQKNKPVFGVVHIPVQNVTYYTEEGKAYKKENETVTQIEKNNQPTKYSVVASISHLTEETNEYIETLKQTHPNLELKQAGSSLKLLRVAEGTANIYPRLGPTMEWDTAAAHAIVNTCGKTVKKYNPETKEEEGELEYNKKELVNPYFIVS